MIDWIARNRIGVWIALIVAAMVQTWLFGFDAARGSWAVIACVLLLGIRIDLIELLAAIETKRDE